MRLSNHRISSSRVRFVALKDEYRLKDAGRWGPRWLHKLVWVAARNLGMLSHPMERETIRTWRPIENAKAEQAISKACLAYLEQDFYRDDLVAYMGPEMWCNLARDEYMRACFTASVSFGSDRNGQRHQRVLGISVIVLPEIEGCLVVPRPERLAA